MATWLSHKRRSTQCGGVLVVGASVCARCACTTEDAATPSFGDGTHIIERRRLKGERTLSLTARLCAYGVIRTPGPSAELQFPGSNRPTAAFSST